MVVCTDQMYDLILGGSMDRCSKLHSLERPRYGHCECLDRNIGDPCKTKPSSYKPTYAVS